LLALTSTIGPFYGRGYTPQAFVTVVVGGAADIFVGALASVLSLGAIRTVVTAHANILIGNVAMLVFASWCCLCRPEYPSGLKKNGLLAQSDNDPLATSCIPTAHGA